MRSIFLFATALFWAAAGLGLGCGGDDFTPGSGADAGVGGGTAGAGGQGGAQAGAGGSATGGASGAAGGTAGGGGVAGAGGAAQENCWDGKDNDANGKIDCDDPQCAVQGFACVAPGPEDSSTGFLVGANDTCPDGTYESGLWKGDTLTAEPAQCTLGCDIQCTASVACSGDGTCSSPLNATQDGFSGTTCANSTVGFASGVFSCQATAVGTGCSAKIDSVTKNPIQWPMAGKFCTASSGGTCGTTSEICIPKPSSSLASSVLIVDDTPCVAPYLNKTVYYDGMSVHDQRSCTVNNGLCTMTGTPPACTGVIGIYCGSCASTPEKTIDIGGSCSGAIDSKCLARFAIQGQLTAVSTSACGPSGEVVPTGTVEPTNPLTLCCQ